MSQTALGLLALIGFSLLIILIVPFTFYVSDNLKEVNSKNWKKRKKSKQSKLSDVLFEIPIGNMDNDNYYNYEHIKIVSPIIDIRKFVENASSEDEFYEEYKILFGIYESLLVSLNQILKDPDLLKEFENDIDMKNKMDKKLQTLLNDLQNIRQTYVKEKYNQITSFL